ncbi:SDR family oxidoreductase [Paenibacillus aceris]|uniref:3-oxoacyl-[acyl-carrier protein] reductase n=1 Tax=Paenibacillus aceris TaxID=869555 RepID=A0ABS4I4Z2_9BACL|nr:SDR family oxidoreductase [Paenibacillus aceris]MBP1965983.1 3-oxoacyl-[acyl-carrier protein] reductase [Paenibacillus aceris]NHW35020.1 SDR family oxidoreductase [Paenibacillus aceris]
MYNLSGKVAIVTGASRGIGREIAELLAQHGAKVVINFASNPAKAEEVVAGIKQNSGEALAVQADIGQVAEIEMLFEKTLAAFGQIDILVNNAGIMITKPLAAMTEDDFDKQFAVNVKGTYFACQQALKHMNKGGRIINFSTSVAGMMFPAYSVYAGTKGAVEQFTRQLAKELGPAGITINAVAPGPVNTELFTIGKSEEQVQGIKNMNAFGRLGEPDDIAGAVLFLASEESRWITGQTIRINGGMV